MAHSALVAQRIERLRPKEKVAGSIPAEGTFLRRCTVNDMAVTQPTWRYEEQYWDQAIGLIAGIDEVGMGALAGPVCAAAVVFNSQARPSISKSIPIRDSKSLSAAQREKAAAWTQEHALAWAVGEASVEEIQVLNILQAARLAMKRAVEQLRLTPDLLLVDGNPVRLHESIPAVNLVQGDQLSYSIAAASILAKVHRDHIMTTLDHEFPLYNFAAHKGYGSAAHLAALKTHGATPHHRATYAPVAAALKQL